MERMPFKNKIKNIINNSDSKVNKMSPFMKQITSTLKSLVEDENVNIILYAEGI